MAPEGRGEVPEGEPRADEAQARGVTQGLVLPDIHWPDHAERTVAAVRAYMRDEWWDWIILLGDAMNAESLNHHTEGRPRLRTGYDVAAELGGFRKFLTELVADGRAKNPDATVEYIGGNHEDWYEQFADRNPEFASMLHLPTALGFDENRITWVDFWRKGIPARKGKAYFIHGLTTTKYHTNANLERYGVNLFTGHTHDVQEISRFRAFKQASVAAKSLGCLCNYEPTYMRGRPARWQHAFSVFHVWPDGTFQELTVKIQKARFVAPTNGRVYSG